MCTPWPLSKAPVDSASMNGVPALSSGSHIEIPSNIAAREIRAVVIPSCLMAPSIVALISAYPCELLKVRPSLVNSLDSIEKIDRVIDMSQNSKSSIAESAISISIESPYIAVEISEPQATDSKWFVHHSGSPCELSLIHI